MITKNEKKLIHFVTISLVLSLLYLFNISIISKIGFICILLFFIVLFIATIIKFIHWKIDAIFSLYLIILVINACNLIARFNFQAVYVFFQITALLLIPVVATKLQLNQKVFDAITSRIEIITVVLAIISIGLNLLKMENRIISTTYYKALLGGILVILYKRHHVLTFLLSFFLLYVLGERTSALIVVIYWIGLFMIKRVKSKKMITILFCLGMLALWVFPYFYVNLSTTSLGTMINTFVKEKTGENFFSGRHVIWKTALSQPNIFYGLGLGNNYLQSFEISFSTHNLYIFIYLVGGYLTLLPILLFFILLAINILNKKKSYLMVWISILILVTFELILLNNNMTVSLWLWIIVSIGLVNYKKEDEENRNEEIYCMHSNL